MIRIKILVDAVNRHTVLLDSVQCPRCSLAGSPIRRARRADFSLDVPLGAASVCDLRGRERDAISEHRGGTDCGTGGQYSASGRAQ